MISGRGRILILLLSFWLRWTESYWWWGNVDRSWDAKDNVGLENRWKMRNISHELLSQAIVKTRHILDIRDYYQNSIAFEVGYIMGKLREKYRRMMEHYYQWRDKASGKSAFSGPGIKDIKPIHFLLTMEHIFTYEADIHKNCDALIRYFNDDTYPVEGGARINREILKRMAAKQRLVNKENKHRMNSTKTRRMEEKLKSTYRQQHLMRRLGLPVNFTTKSKRFQRDWPVEGSWDFGPYDIGI